MPEHDAAEALRIAQQLHGVVSGIAGDLHGIAGRLDDTTAYARRTRRIARVLAVLVIVMAVLFAGVRQAQVRACGVGNDARTAQRMLWDHVIQLSAGQPPPRETAAARKRRLAGIAAFRAYIGRQFRPAGCPWL